jgi:hypothetical protein
MNTSPCSTRPSSLTCPDREAGIATTSWAVPSGATPRHGVRRGADRKRATPMGQVGSRKESIPPSAWTESGRTPVLTESSNSREYPHPADEGALLLGFVRAPLARQRAQPYALQAEIAVVTHERVPHRKRTGRASQRFTPLLPTHSVTRRGAEAGRALAGSAFVHPVAASPAGALDYTSDYTRQCSCHALQSRPRSALSAVRLGGSSRRQLVGAVK